MEVPIVLINSCSKFSAENIVKGILNTDNLPEEKVLIENIPSYPWTIDTKYYSAEVQLCITRDRTIGDENFAACVQAFVVYFDPDEENTFQQVKSWLSYLNQLDPEIKMLVCDRCTENSEVSRLKAQTWCIENGFELVELNAEELSDSETEDDFVETTGIKRIIQSLHAHPWPNLVMKDQRNTVSPYIRQLMKEEHDAKQANKTDSINNSSTNDTDTQSEKDTTILNKHGITSEDGPGHFLENGLEDVSENGLERTSKNCVVSDNVDKETDSAVKTTSGSEAQCDAAKGLTSESKVNSSKEKPVKDLSREQRIDNLFPSDQALFEALGSEDPEGQSFEELFEQFASMKEKANSLPQEERKKYAETVAIAFWRAMGGDEDEIDDLEDD